MGHRVGDHLHPLIQAKQGVALLGVTHGRHHHPVEDLRRDLDDLQMSVVEGIERSREQGGLHISPSRRSTAARRGSGRATVTTVPPYFFTTTVSHSGPGFHSDPVSATRVWVRATSRL